MRRCFKSLGFGHSKAKCGGLKTVGAGQKSSKCDTSQERIVEEVSNKLLLRNPQSIDNETIKLG